MSNTENSKPKEEKPEPPATLTIGVPGKPPRSTHKIYKNEMGEVMVDHTHHRKGTSSTHNLTHKKGVTSVKQGVTAFKTYHKKKGM